MPLRNPPSWLQQGSHPAENDRLTMQAIIGSTGIIGATSLAVSASSPAAMSVSVASGWGSIVGNSQANMGVYTIYNDAATTLTIPPAHPTLPRIDLICVTVSDAFYSGAVNQVAFQVIEGTPAGSPVVPTTPNNSLALARVAVAAGATSIVTGNITDLRVATTTPLAAAGDITEVTAGTGLSGGGTSGAVTLSINSSVVATLTGTQTLTNKTLTAPALNAASLRGPEEVVELPAGTMPTTFNVDLLTAGIYYYNGTASGTAGTMNIRGDGSNTLNSILPVGASATVSVLLDAGSGSGWIGTVQVDGVTQTVRWLGGTAPVQQNSASILYTINVVKTAATPTYRVLGSWSRYA